MGCQKLTYNQEPAISASWRIFTPDKEKTVSTSNFCIDYYTFGMPMPGRNYNSNDYEYGFDGMRKDDEIKGEGNSYDFGARIYSARLGKWMTIDPLAGFYANLSPYSFVANSPISSIDPDGRKIIFVNGYYNTGEGWIPSVFSKYMGSHAGKKYWSSRFIDGGIEYFGENIDPDYHEYIDGSGTLNSSGSERYEAGYEYAKNHFCELIDGAMDESDNQIETIKIVSHSMGSAYAEGIIKYLEERNIEVEKVVHFSSADASEFVASKKPKTLQINLEDDAVLEYKNDLFSRNDIKGIDRYGEVNLSGSYIENAQTSHAATKNDKEVWNYVKDLENAEFEYLYTKKVLKSLFEIIEGTITTWPPGTDNLYDKIPVYRMHGNSNGTDFNHVRVNEVHYTYNREKRKFSIE